MSQTNRLIQHRERFEQARGTGPLLRVEELLPDEVVAMNATFFDRIRSIDASDLPRMYEAYLQTLHHWGVMCPHPQHHRLYSGWLSTERPMTFDESKWFDCILCDASVINR